MNVSLWLAPAAGGKTTAVVDLVRNASTGLSATPRVVVPSHLQVRALRRRIANAGGTIGARFLTFDGLYAELLSESGSAYTELSEPVLYRLIRSQLHDLTYYAPLVAFPGFTSSLQALFDEFKAALITPEALTEAIQSLGNDARLAELALIYSRYQEQLQAMNAADRTGLGWLALEVLRTPEGAGRWPLLIVDGFDTFTPLQLELLKALAGRVDRLVITLTGSLERGQRPLVYRRFEATRRAVEEALGIQAEPLPGSLSPIAPALRALEERLFAPATEASPSPAPAIELIEAPDRSAEVRAALRWCKARLLIDGMPLHAVALLARDIAPYRQVIQQTAAEFGLPVRLVEGLPLKTNPVIAALLDLLRLMLTVADAASPANDTAQPADTPPETSTEPSLPYRLVVEAWRSPYFDWSALPAENAPEPIGIAPGDADGLAAIARWGQVVGGLAQWREALDLVAKRNPSSAEHYDDRRAAGLPTPAEAALLRGRFERFVQRLTPPPELPTTYRGYVSWLEDLIGADPDPGSVRYPVPEEPTSLRVVARVRAGPAPGSEHDLSALRALKDILRGLVWAEEALTSAATLDYAAFFQELEGAVEAAVYRPPVEPGQDELLVASVRSARGLPLRAAAILGLAEGEFPKTQHEDPLLRETDRTALRQKGLRLESAIDSAEVEAFYEAITRPSERLLLTRPRLAENGAEWKPSPLWEEARRVSGVRPLTLTSETPLPPDQVASWPELMEYLAATQVVPATQVAPFGGRPAAAGSSSLHVGPSAGPAASPQTLASVRAWIEQADPSRLQRLECAARTLRQREQPASTPGEGDLSSLATDLAERYGSNHVWSASRLEVYRSCPFRFLVASALGLEPRAEPTEGLDVAQTGTIYHQILEEVYQSVSDRRNLDQLLNALPAVANRVLDAAPREQGFRETAWWQQTRQEMVENLRRTLIELDKCKGEWTPAAFEQAFGFAGQRALVVSAGGLTFRMHGMIDRVDVIESTVEGAPHRLRIIDYKSSGPSGYTNDAVAEGKKLQLPLYSLAARDALKLGEPKDGFYWHVVQAEPSRFTLAGFKVKQGPSGPEAAMRAAANAAAEAVLGVREGRFPPTVPDDDCPSYCPAVGFCWHYRPGYWA